MRHSNDMDHAEWLNGPEAPECVECGDPTTRVNDVGIPIHLTCEENRNEAAYERQMARGLSGGGSASEVMDLAYQTDRRMR